MRHLAFLVYSIALASGVAVVSRLLVARRRNTSRLIVHFLFFHLTFMGLIIFITVTVYFSINIDHSPLTPALFVSTVLVALGVLSFFMPRYYYAVLNKPMTGLLKALAIVPLFLFPALALGHYIFYASYIRLVFLFVGIAYLLSITTYCNVLYVRSYPPLRSSRAARLISVLFVLFSTLAGFSEGFLLREQIQEYGYTLSPSVIYLAWNLIVLLYPRLEAPFLRVRKVGEVPDLVSLYGMTPQEALIARKILEGLSNKEIAFELSISPHTVKNHISNVLRKAGAQSRVQLIARLGAPED
jgi:DNA-binding CsgD family transcriptional regulator